MTTLSHALPGRGIHSHAPEAAVAPRWVRLSYVAAMVLVAASVAMGSIVAATHSSAACPTWPGCYPDALAPHAMLSPVLEMGHRVVAALTGPAILAALVASFTRPGREFATRVLPWLALLGAIAAAVFGRLTVLYGISAALGATDLGMALMAMLAMTGAAVGVRRAPYAVAPTRTLGLATGGVVVIWAMHVLGILVAGQGSYTSVVGWPVWHLVDGDLHPWLQLVRLGLAFAATALLIGAAASAWPRRDLRGPAVAVVALWALELVLGLAMGGHPVSDLGAITYAVVAVGILLSLALLAALAGIERVTPGAVADER